MRFSRWCCILILCVLAESPAAQSWSQLSPTGTPPVARGLHGTTGVYDPASNRMIVFGGRDSNGDNLNDVWILTNANGLGGTGQWINLIANGADGSPPARSGHSAAYDTANNILIIFGGCSGFCTPALNDVWTLSHANGLGGTPVWTQLSPSTMPPPRTNAVATYLPSLNQFFVYGGQDGSADPCSTLSDAWLLSNANALGNTPSAWTTNSFWFNSDNPPPAPNGASSIYYPGTATMTIFGGTAMVNGVCTDTNTLWELNLSDPTVPGLTLVPPNSGGFPPSGRSHHSAVYDASSGRMLIFGGEAAGIALNEAWSLSDVTGLGAPVWKAVIPIGDPPPAREGQAAVFDSVNQRMTIFGGNNASGVLNDSWVLTTPVPGAPFSCSVNAGAPTVAHTEGISELVGDLILTCTGGTPTGPGEPILQYALYVSMNTNITSRLQTGVPMLSEALAIVDEAFPANPVPVIPQVPSQPPQILCTSFGSVCPETGTGGDPSPYQTQPNVFVGLQFSPVTLKWVLPIDPPGLNLFRRIRFTNVRANVAQLGISPGLMPTYALGNVDLVGSLGPVFVSAPLQTVAVSRPGVISTVTPSQPIFRCTPHNPSLAGGSGAAAFDFSVHIEEGFGTALEFRNWASILGLEFPEPLSEQNLPGQRYFAETGLYSPSLFTPDPTLGLADSGTRIRVKFGPLPAGVRLFIPVTITMTGEYGDGVQQGELRLIQADKNGISSPGYQPVAAKGMVGTTPVAEVSYSGSTGYAIYEVVYADPTVAETLTIPVAVAFKTAPPAGQVDVTPALVPLDTTAIASATAFLPRFNGVAAPLLAFSVDQCKASTLSTVISTKSGPLNARVWDVKVKNGANPAFGTEIESLKLTHTAGKGCTPTITSPSFPFSLGDLPAKTSVTTPVTIDFTGCASTSKFKTTVHLTANDGTANTTDTLSNEAP